MRLSSQQGVREHSQRMAKSSAQLLQSYQAKLAELLVEEGLFDVGKNSGCP